MDNLSYILFICLVAPLALMFLILRRRSRLLVGYMLIGVFVSLFVSELNTILLGLFSNDVLYVTTTITPISEEIVKALPILFYAIVFSDDRDKIMPIAFALGVGFAMFENMVVLVQNVETVTIGWAIIRGFSTALMHAVCTIVVGYGISFMKKRRKLFFCGTLALLALTMIYHGIFNMLMQSKFQYIGSFMPGATYIPILNLQYQYYKKKVPMKRLQDRSRNEKKY